MKIIFILNKCSEITYKMTTSRLILTSLLLKYETWVGEVDCFSINTNNQMMIKGRCVDPSTQLEQIKDIPISHMVPSKNDLIFLRLNPSRLDSKLQFDLSYWCLMKLSLEGHKVINRPDLIEVISSKAFLSSLPDSIRPRQFVTSCIDEAMQVIKEFDGKIILKTLRGTRGKGVFLTKAKDPGLKSLIEILLDKDAIAIQEYIASKNRVDKRIILVRGQIVMTEKGPLAIQRAPSKTDFRANLHSGATPSIAHLSKNDYFVIESLKTYLKDIDLAGVDVVNGKIIEINVWSPGGIVPFETNSGIEIVEDLFKEIIKIY